MKLIFWQLRTIVCVLILLPQSVNVQSAINTSLFNVLQICNACQSSEFTLVNVVSETLINLLFDSNIIAPQTDPVEIL